MELETLTLQSLRTLQLAMTADQFAETYEGAFLLPMGFLSVQEIMAAKDLDATAGVRLGQPLRHDPSQSHPLAGKAYFMRSTQAAKDACSLGRGPESDICVPDDSVSYTHCRLQLGPAGEVLVTDLGSTNGTKINLDPVDVGVTTVMSVEDILTVGRYSFQVHTPPSLFDALSLIAKLDGLSE